MYKKILLSLLVSCSFSTLALAGGYQLQEYSITNLGRAFGGAGVAGDDYSAVAFNPAGMMLKDTGVQLGAGAIAIRGHGKGILRNRENETPLTGPGKGKLRTNALLPHFFGQTKVGDRVRLGAGVYVPFGLGTYYKKSWFGNTHALNSEIKTVDTAVAMAVQLTDTISIGGSAFLEYVDARLTNASYAPLESDLNADNWHPGYTFGIMYQPQKETRFGISYRSKVDHQLKGPHYLHVPGHDFKGDCGTKLVMPEHLMFSAYHEIGDFGISGVARWTRWSRFAKLKIYSDAYAQTGQGEYLPTVDEDWRNTWTIGVGVDYHYNQNWTYRAGFAVDQGAVKRSANRTARVPDSNRYQTSLGFSYTKDNWQFDMAYMHLFWKTTRSYNDNQKTIIDARYHVRTDILGASLQYHF